MSFIYIMNFILYIHIMGNVHYYQVQNPLDSELSRHFISLALSLSLYPWQKVEWLVRFYFLLYEGEDKNMIEMIEMSKTHSRLVLINPIHLNLASAMLLTNLNDAWQVSLGWIKLDKTSVE